jgi:hypothetical protein
MVEVQRIGTVEPLSAYTALRDYGWQTSELKTSQILDYESPATVLANWIDTGEVNGLTPVLAPLRGLSSADERRVAATEFLLTTLADYEEQYVAYREEIESTKRKTSQPPDWPSLWPAMRTGLQQLADAVQATATASFDEESM